MPVVAVEMVVEAAKASVRVVVAVMDAAGRMAVAAAAAEDAEVALAGMQALVVLMAAPVELWVETVAPE